MKEILMNKNKIISLVLAVFLIVGIAAVSGNFKASAAEINDINPELMKVDINGTIDLESAGYSYVPDSKFTQNTKEGIYTLSSNSYCAWGSSDDVSFAYKEYNVAPVDSDSLTVECTIDSFYSDTQGNVLHPNASAGIMLRTGLKNTSACVFLHVREQGVMIVYRSKDGSGYGFYSEKSFSYPVQLKMVLSGNSVECRYKDANRTKWSLVGYAAFAYTGPVYAGISTHSVDRETYAKGEFSNLSMTGFGSYDPSTGGSDNTGTTSSEVKEPIDEDLDLSANKNIVLYETFSKDNEQAIAVEAATGEKTAYSWTSGQKTYNYETQKWDSAVPEYHDLEIENGNRYLHKSLLQDSISYIGDETWSDYRASMDVQFTEKCDPSATNASNMVKLMARSRLVEWYGRSGYAATLQNELINGVDTTTISLYKMVNDSIITVSDNGTRVAGPIAVDSFLGDGNWHNLAIEVFDNEVTVYYDYEKMIEYVDPGDDHSDITVESGKWEEIIGFGNVGVSTNQTDCYIDNIIVELIPDEINGDYDNYVGGGWDDPIPAVIDNWVNEKEYQYYFNGVNGSNSVASKSK